MTSKMSGRGMRAGTLGLIASAAAALAACSGDDTEVTHAPTIEFNAKPAYVGSVSSKTYDGNSDDLLTAGLGRTGLASAVAPTASATPTAAELRRLAIYNNYRALVDMTTAGGYGVFYGPGVSTEGTAATGEGKIAGTEVMAFSTDSSGAAAATLMVQIPDNFSVDNACIVTATSSGSRGILGGFPWGLGCVRRGGGAATPPGGRGGAPHDLANDTVPLIDGTRATSAAAGNNAQFRANLTSAELAALNTATPNRFAFKHAHSQRNPEKDWGSFTLQAVEFAFWALNEKYGAVLDNGQRERKLKPSNTLVIASSISNGGGAAIAAAEKDESGLIDGVAVAEPAVELPAEPGVSVRRGAATVGTVAKTLYDFTSYANVYQPCAALSPQVAGTPGTAFVVAAFATNRCASLKAKGLLTADTTAAQADEALQKLRDYGWEAEATPLHASHAAFEIASAVTVTFGNALSRASVKDHLCGYSFGSTTAQGVPNALAAASLATMAATGNGVPPSAGVQLINNLSPGAPLRDLFSFSPSTGSQDFNLDGALCLRNLLTGAGPQATALRTGIDETRRNGNLRGKPALIVHGRSDALLPVNHTSRPYTALNKKVEGGASKLSYIEVANAQHFDGFIGLPAVLPGYDTRYVPLHIYLNRALDAMYAHLKTGTALPASQVVRTVPRGGTAGAAPALTAANVPAIAATPAAANAITVTGTTLNVPD